MGIRDIHYNKGSAVVVHSYWRVYPTLSTAMDMWRIFCFPGRGFGYPLIQKSSLLKYTFKKFNMDGSVRGMTYVESQLFSFTQASKLELSLDSRLSEESTDNKIVTISYAKVFQKITPIFGHSVHYKEILPCITWLWVTNHTKSRKLAKELNY